MMKFAISLLLLALSLGSAGMHIKLTSALSSLFYYFWLETRREAIIGTIETKIHMVLRQRL
jgi:hypothetical protein